MDSGNSSGMQSSSGGDEEHDSRPDSITAVAFLSQMSNHQPRPHFLRHQNHAPSFFDPPSNHNLPSNFLASPENSASNMMLNQDILWPPVTGVGGITSDLKNTKTTAQVANSSSSFAAALVQSLTQGNGTPSASLAGTEPSQSRPRKRTRASRKAPTTVLTTDTTNFRAKVQEFTGITAAPFSAAASPYPRRFHLLPSTSCGSSSPAGTANTLRPSAEKLQISPPPSNPNPALTRTNMVENFAPCINNNRNYNILNQSANYNSSPNSDLQLPWDDNGVENPFFAFQSFLSPQLPPFRHLSTNQFNHESLATICSSLNQDQQSLSDNIGGYSDVGPTSNCGMGSKTNDDGSRNKEEKFM